MRLGTFERGLLYTYEGVLLTDLYYFVQILHHSLSTVMKFKDKIQRVKGLSLSEQVKRANLRERQTECLKATGWTDPHRRHEAPA